MKDLIERLEAAECGSRELDLDVVVGLGLAKRPRPGFRYNADPVTTSLDAALALAERVLPGQARAMGDMAFDPPGKPWAVIWTKGGDPKFSTEAATTPLALCAAILGARLDAEGKGE